MPARAPPALEIVLASIADAVITTDREYRITSWNPAAERMYGWSAAEVEGRRVPDVVLTVLTADERRACAEALSTRGIWTGDVVQRHRDGRPMHIHSTVTRVPGDPDAVVAVNRDITERWEAERALEQAREHLMFAQKMEALGRLAGGVAHDFNNLLTVVLGGLELVSNQLPADHPTQRTLHLAHSTGQRAATLARQLLAFAKRDLATHETLDLVGLLDEVHGLLARAAGESVRLELKLAPGPLWVHGTRLQVEHALVNLVVNARDALPVGGKVTITVEPVGERVRVDVQDDGHGMDEATRARAFEPFFSTKPAGQGTGLGLSMVFGMAQSMGGSVALRSAPGRGTLVRLTLPSAPAPAAAAPEPTAQAAPRRRGLRVLLAEDQELVREVLAAMLHALGHQVYAAVDGIDAQRLVNPTTIDLLVTDVVMPRCRGPELAGALRARVPGLPVVYLSAYAAQDALDGEWPPGVRLSKPTTMAALAGAIEAALSTAPSAAP